MKIYVIFTGGDYEDSSEPIGYKTKLEDAIAMVAKAEADLNKWREDCRIYHDASDTAWILHCDDIGSKDTRKWTNLLYRTWHQEYMVTHPAPPPPEHGFLYYTEVESLD